MFPSIFGTGVHPLLRYPGRWPLAMVNAFACAMFLSPCAPAEAAWFSDPATNNAICTATGMQLELCAVSDTQGGAIFAWRDDRTDSDVYAQRIDMNGNTQWAADGLAVCALSSFQDSVCAVPDGSGGVIIVWRDFRNVGTTNGDIYAQRLNALGVEQWTANGVIVCDATALQTQPAVASDGAGGVLVTWIDNRAGGVGTGHTYVQRLNSSGAALWTEDGVVICNSVGNQSLQAVCRDGAGGAIVVWKDARGGIDRAYTQRVNNVGTEQWTSGGTDVALAFGSADGNMSYLRIMPDGSGGAFYVWSDSRNDVDEDIYAQRLNSAAAKLWTTTGESIAATTGGQSVPQIVSDYSGGAIIAWEDTRNGNLDIYAQRINSSGAAQWTGNGVAVCTSADIQYKVALLAQADATGDSIMAWSDFRSGSSYDIYAQRLSSNGSAVWVANGKPVCTAAFGQVSPVIATDTASGAVIGWMDSRGGADPDIYTSYVLSTGTLVPVHLSKFALE